jgi:hypothetical protein
MTLHAGSSKHVFLDKLEQLAWLAVEGLELEQAAGSDLPGWLDDLAPKGDLTSRSSYTACPVSTVTSHISLNRAMLPSR